SLTSAFECSTWNSSGVTVAGGNGQGSAANQLDYPGGIAVSPSGDVYVADSGNNRIQFWSVGATQGAATATVVAGGYGSGSALNQFAANWHGFTVDTLSNIYILDTGNNRIVKWAPGATNGQVVVGGNGQGDGADQLNEPQGLAIDAQFTIFVADSANRRIQACINVAVSVFISRCSRILRRKLESRVELKAKQNVKYTIAAHIITSEDTIDNSSLDISFDSSL
ncbi:unnamed protein product, partial [Rotaria sp. Silwood2]